MMVNCVRLLSTLTFLAVAWVPTAGTTQHKMETLTLSEIRGMRYCEFLLVFDHGIDVYNTSASDGCPEDKWAVMDTAALAKELGAKKVLLNGPKFWAMDEQEFQLGETKTLGGIDARYGATLPLATVGSGEGDAYTGFTSSKKQTMVFKAGRPVYELIGPEGYAYILNAYGGAVKDGDPANLKDQLSPADGWSFRVATPAENLIVAAPEGIPTQMVGDDMKQYYTRHGTAEK